MRRNIARVKGGFLCLQFQIGCKLPPLPKQDWLKKRMAAGFCMELLAGESSVFFQKAYEWEWLMRHSALPFSAARGMPLRHFRAVGRIRRKQRIFWEGSWSACNKKAFRRRIFSVSAKSTWGSSCGSWIHRRSSALDQLAWARMDATAIDLLTCIKTVRQEEVEKMLKEGFSKENIVLSVVK